MLNVEDDWKVFKRSKSVERGQKGAVTVGREFWTPERVRSTAEKIVEEFGYMPSCERLAALGHNSFVCYLYKFNTTLHDLAVEFGGIHNDVRKRVSDGM